MEKYLASIYNYFFNSVNSIVMIVNGIILVPIYFKYMSLSTYGAWLATGNVVAMLGLVESGFSGVITQKMAVALSNNDEDNFLVLASANIYTAIIMSLALFFVGLSIAPFIADWINVEASIKPSIELAYIISVSASSLSIVFSLFGAFPQVWQKTRAIGIITTIVNLISILSLLLFLYSGFGVVSLAMGYLTRSILNLIGLIVWIRLEWKERKIKNPKFNVSTSIKILRECFYPFLSKISSSLMGSSQSFIIALFISPAASAVYDITSKISIVASNFLNLTNGSFFALFSLSFASNNLNEINSLIKKITILFITALFFVLLFSYVFTEPIIYFWVGLDKYGGDILLGIIVVAFFINQLKRYFNNLLYTGGLIDKSAKLDILSLLLYILILLTLIKKFQLYAIPLAISASGLIFIYSYLRILKKYLFVNISFIYKEIMKLLLITLIFIFIHSFLPLNLMNLMNLMIYGIILITFYILIIGITNISILKSLLDKIRFGE